MLLLFGQSYICTCILKWTVLEAKVNNCKHTFHRSSSIFLHYLLSKGGCECTQEDYSSSYGFQIFKKLFRQPGSFILEVQE